MKPILASLFFTTTIVLLPVAQAQSSGVSPNVQCTNNLCRPIGNIMAYCVDGSGQTSPNEITWDDLYIGNNITDEDTGDVVTARLRCFCRSVGIQSMLDNCYTCYVNTNQEQYWNQGISKIKQRCGFPPGLTSDASESKVGILVGKWRITPGLLSGVAVGGIGLGIGAMFGL